MTDFSANNLTQNAFLGGLLQLWQPVQGYRAGIDPVLLAASVPALPGQKVLELGCGAGVAILCLGVRMPELMLHGVELQPPYGELARRNAVENGLELAVSTGDLNALPSDLRQINFDHVIANPPFFRAGAHTGAEDAGRAIAMGEATPLETWIDVAARRLAPKGYLHMIQRAERLPDLIAACTGRLGSLEILPLSARMGRAPGLILLRARKNGRAAFILHAPLVLHNGPAHLHDKDSYTSEINGILRSGAALNWPAKS